MMKKTLTLLALCSMIFTLGCAEQPGPEESCNFSQNSLGRRVSWAQLPVVFYANETLNNDQVYAVRRAVNVWNDSLGREIFDFRGRVNPGQLPPLQIDTDGDIVSDGFNTLQIANQVLFQNIPGRDEQARAGTSFRGDFIFESDIIVDESQDLFYSEPTSSGDLIHYYIDDMGNAVVLQDLDEARQKGLISFESLMIHELGHTLGLDHIDDIDSVMAPVLASGQLRVDISDTDLDSLACEY